MTESNVVPMRTPAPMAPRDYNGNQLALIKRTVARDCTGDEFDMFVEMCRRVGLDPFRRQIYALVFNKDKPEKRQVAFVTSIQGYRAVAARAGDYRPDDDEPQIEFDDAAKDPDVNPLGLVKAVVRCYKRDPAGEWHAVVGRAYWDEYAPIKEKWAYSEKEGRRAPTGEFELAKDNWRKMGKLMLAKCAEAQALQKGWPEDMSGFYVAEEMDQALAQEASASEAAEAAEQQRRLAMVGAKNTLLIQWKYGAEIESVEVGQLMDRALAFIEDNESGQVAWWRDVNREALKQFWAHHKADALELKGAIEKKLKDAEAAPA